MTNINLNSEETITISTNTLSGNFVEISDINISTITLDDTHWADSIRWDPIEFEDSMPTVAKVEDMCNDYPALAKAYKNFKTIYTMVEQDWKGRQDDELPF